MRRAAAVFILAIGCGSLWAGMFAGVAWFTSGASTPTDPADPLVAFVTLFYLPTGLLAVLGGTWMWGWNRRRVALGVLSAILGSLWLVTMGRGLPANEEQLRLMRIGSVLGFVLIGLGALLILAQRRIDR